MNATVAKIQALPQLPTVWAVNIYAAQGFKLEGDARAAVLAWADFYESEGLPRTVALNVINPRTGCREGLVGANV